MLHIDFETRSAANLVKTGVVKYANDPTTDIWCLAYALDTGPVELIPFEGVRCPATRHPLVDPIVDHIEQGGLVYAHNVAFEYHIWNAILHKRYGWPPLKIEQCYCTMAEAYAMGLPGSLDAAAKALQLIEEKDAAGGRLMKQMMKPRKIHPDGTLEWWDDPARKERLYEYCKQDVVVERKLHDRLLRLSERERQTWLLDQRINNRGVYLDIPAARKGIDLIAHEKQRLDAEMAEVTDDVVGACSNVTQLHDWLADHGCEIDGVAKDQLRQLVIGHESGDKPLAPKVLRAIQLRQEAGRSSTAKLEAMLHSADDDGRARHLMQYYAAHTGRWGGRRIQTQNLPRPVEIKHMADIEDAVQHFDGPAYLEMVYGDPLPVLSSCLRALVRAEPGSRFLVQDFSNIEGRVLAWLAGEEWKLEAFRAFDAGTGPDIYLVTAGSITGKRPEDSKPDRQVLGKVPELALGFGGGVGAFESMAAVYGVNMAEHYDKVVQVAGEDYKREAIAACRERGEVDTVEDAKKWVASEIIKLKWRERHPRTKQFWYDLETAAIDAVRRPGTVTNAGAAGREIRFRVRGSFLFCQLPSKRTMVYPYPSVRSVTKKFGKSTSTKDTLHYYGNAQKDGGPPKWQSLGTYGGKLAENVTQAVARDLLCDAMHRVEDRSYPVVMHVHDELVTELPHGRGSLQELGEIMAQVPQWAEGLPVGVDGWEGERYRKD